MLSQSVLKNQMMMSPLAGQSTLKPKGWRRRKSLLFSLTLTSLIDAFSILVIYLLVSFSPSSGALKFTNNMNLPSAEKSTTLDKGTVLSIDSGRYYIEGREVPFNSIVSVLTHMRENAKDENMSLVIQADKKLDYATLSPVILAGSHAGFQQFKFAVLQSAAGVQP